MNPLPGWNKELLVACSERCAEYAEPPCLDVKAGCQPCDECKEECGIPLDPPPLDPDAVVRPLL